MCHFTPTLCFIWSPDSVVWLCQLLYCLHHKISTSQYLPTLPQKVISEQWRSPLGFCIPATYSSVAGFLPKKELIQLLLYCANYIHNPLKICNVFNGSHYQWLLQHHVIINSKKQLYQYFLDRRNLAFRALALCLSSILQEAQWPISYANIVGKL